MDIKNCLIYALLFLICHRYAEVGGKRLVLHPLSPRQVEWVLKEADREDVIPEGRTLGSGLAALGGFTAGMVKSLTGVLLFDLWAIGVNLTEPTPEPQIVTSEICFVSRATQPRRMQYADEYDDDDDESYDNDDDDEYDEYNDYEIRYNRYNKRRKRALAYNAEEDLTCVTIEKARP